MRLLFTGKFPTNSVEYNLYRDARFFLQAPPTYLLSPIKGKGLLMSIQDYYMTGGVQETSMRHALRQRILDVPCTLCVAAVSFPSSIQAISFFSSFKIAPRLPVSPP